MTLWQRTLFALFSALHTLVRKELTMVTDRTYRLFLACPVADLASLQDFFYSILGRPVGSFDLVLELGVDSQPPALMRAGSDTFTDAEIALLRPWLTTGEGFSLGIKGRRGFNSATEIAAPDTAPGKVTVTVIEEGEPIPSGVDWADVRLTFPRFLEELGLGIIEPVI